MYAFRFYAHKNDLDKSSSSLKEYFKRTADLPQDADAAAHIKIMRDLKSDSEFGSDLMSPFGYSNDSVRPKQVQLDESTTTAADFMHKNFKVDPDEVWSDANLKDVYYDCSEPIYQAYYTTKLKPSVLAGAKGHFE